MEWKAIQTCRAIYLFLWQIAKGKNGLIYQDKDLILIWYWSEWNTAFSLVVLIVTLYSRLIGCPELENAVAQAITDNGNIIQEQN